MAEGGRNWEGFGADPFLAGEGELLVVLLVTLSHPMLFIQLRMRQFLAFKLVAFKRVRSITSTSEFLCHFH